MHVLPPAGPLRRRQLLRVGGLVLALAVVAWFRFGRGPASQVGDAPSTAGEGPVEVAALPEPIRLDDLDTLPALGEADRNPFAYGVRSAPAAPVTSSAPYVPPPAAPAPPQGPPPIQLRLAVLTVLPGSERSLVTLTDPATHGLYQGFEGDIVDGRYRIVKVGLESVVVSYLDGSGARTLSLGG